MPKSKKTGKSGKMIMGEKEMGVMMSGKMPKKMKKNKKIAKRR